LRHLAHNVACLELLSYHSKSFGTGALLNSLPSAQAMLAFVHKILLPKAKDNEATIIVTRSVKNWRLPKHKNIVIYESGETRSAHLTRKSRGGEAIAKRLGL